MRERLERRLTELRDELEAGQEKATRLETELEHTRRVMLRISGAIQVLEEELAAESGTDTAAQEGPEA